MTRSQIILRYIVRNCRVGLRHALARRDDYSGTLSSYTPEQAAAYAREVFDRYLVHAGLAPEALRGAAVLEIGPGDSLGVALLCAQAGAASIVSLDKFRYSYDTPRHREIERLLGAGPDAMHRIRPVSGAGIEDAAPLLEPAAFDLILSNAVLEECPDPDRGLSVMNALLRPGGRMLHQIDVSDYGIFSRHGFSALEFLTVSDVVYRAMTASSGGPNRRLRDYYRARLGAAGFDAAFTTTHRYAADAMRLPAIRPRLLPAYRALEEEDLAVSGFFVHARKAP
jgi:SAM-dependent methyltransferase